MRILIAMDKFKGSVDAVTAGAAVAAGIRAADSRHEIEILPFSDGGEGFVECLAGVLDGEMRFCETTGPMGERVRAGYFLSCDGMAVLEMSQASGLWRVAREALDPWRASTAGTGGMMRDALDSGADRLLVGIGGSATNDAGVGMAGALGWEFLDEDGRVVQAVPARFLEIACVRPPTPDPLAACTVEVACDVRNPLLGPHGASRTYGPQKGLRGADLASMDQALAHLADRVEEAVGSTFRDIPGSGAAGGLGFGLLAFAGATLSSGFDLVAERIGLAEAVARADIVVTGEGSYDAQSAQGKGPGALAAMARALSKHTLLIAGVATATQPFDEVRQLIDYAPSRDEAIRQAAHYLETVGKEWMEGRLAAPPNP